MVIRKNVKNSQSPEKVLEDNFKKILNRPYFFILPLVIAAKQFLFRRQVESKIDRRVVIASNNKALGSNLSISIFIPVAIKDIECLSPTVNSLRRYLQHPILEIIICGRNDESLLTVCKELDVKFLDERDVQPVDKNAIIYDCNGVDRSGWLYQQLLKINSINYCESDHLLIWDSDTELLKPTNFESQGRFVIEYSEERHRPYEECTTKLLGKNSGFNLGFTCHKILFDNEILLAMVCEMESRFRLSWHEAIIKCIDTDEASSFSEYNVYSHFALMHFVDSVEIRHWRNFADVKTGNRLRNVLIKRLFSTVSYHSWAQ